MIIKDEGIEKRGIKRKSKKRWRGIDGKEN